MRQTIERLTEVADLAWELESRHWHSGEHPEWGRGVSLLSCRGCVPLLRARYNAEKMLSHVRSLKPRPWYGDYGPRLS